MKKLLGVGHIFYRGKPAKLEEKATKNIYFIPPCPHDTGGYCYKLQLLPKAHCSEDYMNSCGQVKRFYDRYGDDGNCLGI